jgi:hypothetical protein
MTRPTMLKADHLAAESVAAAAGGRATRLCPTQTAVNATWVRTAPATTEASAPYA